MNFHLKPSAQRNENETKQFQNCFETVSLSFRCADGLIDALEWNS